MRMKMKRFFSILFSLALVLGLMPGMSLTAYAADSYNIWVGGVEVTSDNLTIDSTDNDAISGSAIYNSSTSTLTLANFSYSGGGHEGTSHNFSYGAAIYADCDLTIELVENNTVTHAPGTSEDSYGIYVDNHKLIITGNGTLNANGGNTSGMNSYGVLGDNGITINAGATVYATAGGTTGSYSYSYGIYSKQGITVNPNATLIAAGGSTSSNDSKSIGLYTGEGNLAVNGTVTAKGNDYAFATEKSQNIVGFEYTVPDGYTVTESASFDGSDATSVAVGSKTATTSKYVHITSVPPHTHRFTYETSGATITAKCSNTDGCPLASSNYQATLTIAAEGGTYDGTTTYGATVTNNIPAVSGDTVGAIEYYKVNAQGVTTGGTKQTGAPTGAGYYYANVTLTSGSDTYTAVKAFTVAPKALTITGATLTARDYSEGNKNVTVSAVTFDGVTLTLDTDYTATAVMADDTAGSAKSATVTVTLKNSNYSLAQNTYTEATVQINKIAYAGSKTAAANLRGTNGAAAEVTLPALPAGASYGAVTNDNATYFTIGTVADSKVTVTAAKDFNEDTESGDKTFTVAVSGATNFNDYAVTVTITPIFKEEQKITATDVTATYGDTNKKVEATTNGDGAISYAVKDGSADYIDVNASTGALTIKRVGTATVIVTAAETSTYTQATKEVIVTINKANAVAATVTANNRTYDGTEKPLVTVTGGPTGGTMQYALGENATTAPTTGYATSIPTATNAGT